MRHLCDLFCAPSLPGSSVLAKNCNSCRNCPNWSKLLEGALDRELLEIIGSIHDSGTDESAWPYITEALTKYLGVHNTAIVLTDPEIKLARVIAPRADPSVIKDYGSYWWQFDPTAHATAGTAAGVITDLGNTGREQFFSSAFYNDYWVKSGLGAERVAANLFTNGSAFGSIVLQASQSDDEISAETRKKFEMALPHIIMSVGAIRKLAKLEQTLLAGPKGNHEACITVNAVGHVLWCDAQAEKLLTDGRALFLRDSKINTRDTNTTDTLLSIISEYAKDFAVPRNKSTVCLRGENQEDEIVINVVPCPGSRTNALSTLLGGGPVAALFIRHSGEMRDRQVSQLIESFGFTNAEARMALELLKGDGRGAAAKRCNISLLSLPL
jgi:hypothetical protein